MLSISQKHVPVPHLSHISEVSSLLTQENHYTSKQIISVLEIVRGEFSLFVSNNVKNCQTITLGRKKQPYI